MEIALLVVLLFVFLGSSKSSNQSTRTSRMPSPRPRPTEDDDYIDQSFDRDLNDWLPDEADPEEYQKEKEKRNNLLAQLREAKKEEYEKWLEGYLAKGGEVRYERDRKFETGDFYYAPFDITLPAGLCGSDSLRIIIPKGVQVTFEDEDTPHNGRGHCRLFYMEDFSMDGAGAEGFNDLNMKEVRNS